MGTCGDYGGRTEDGASCEKTAVEEYGGRCHQHRLDHPPACAEDLTPRQRAFVDEYLVDFNGTQAAIRAGYSPDSAKYVASENLTKPHIAAVVQQALEARANRTKITQDRVVRELARIAFADIRSMVRWSQEGLTVLSSDELSPDDAAAIREVRLDPKTGDVVVKLHDKLRALRLLCQHLGIAENSLRIKGHDGGPLRIQAMSDRELIEEARQLATEVKSIADMGEATNDSEQELLAPATAL